MNGFDRKAGVFNGNPVVALSDRIMSSANIYADKLAAAFAREEASAFSFAHA